MLMPSVRLTARDTNDQTSYNLPSSSILLPIFHLFAMSDVSGRTLRTRTHAKTAYICKQLQTDSNYYSKLLLSSPTRQIVSTQSQTFRPPDCQKQVRFDVPGLCADSSWQLPKFLPKTYFTSSIIDHIGDDVMTAAEEKFSKQHRDTVLSSAEEGSTTCEG